MRWGILFIFCFLIGCTPDEQLPEPSKEVIILSKKDNLESKYIALKKEINNQDLIIEKLSEDGYNMIEIMHYIIKDEEN